MRRWLVAVGLILAGCGSDPAPSPPSPAPTALPLPTLAVVVPTSTQECGPEAAIALAQTQSDLALAAQAEVDAAEKDAADPAVVGRVGQEAFTSALILMRMYDVPACLLQGKVFAVKFFEERIAAYDALAAGDPGSYEAHLNEGEAARQNMVAVVNGLLGQ